MLLAFLCLLLLTTFHPFFSFISNLLLYFRRTSRFEKKTQKRIKEFREMLLETFKNQTYNRIKRKSSIGKCSPLKYMLRCFMCVVQRKEKENVYLSTSKLLYWKVIRNEMLRAHEISRSWMISIVLNALENQLFSIKRYISSRQMYGGWVGALELPIDTKQWPMTRYFRSHSHSFAIPSWYYQFYSCIFSIKCSFNDAF